MRFGIIVLLTMVCARGFADSYPGCGAMVSAGWLHTCAVDADGVKCWGNNDYGQTKVPQLNHPRQVSVGDFHTCAVDADGVKCWGNDSFGQTRVLKLDDPMQVGAGNKHTCAIERDGVSCWGWNGDGQINVPPLNHPTQVSAGFRHACAIDADGVKCWGNNVYGQTDVPPLNHPIQVSAGWFHTCALDADGVKCWGKKVEGQTNVPPLNHPMQVSAGWLHTCAVDIDGVKCWGKNNHGQTDVPQLNHPTQVSAGGYYACAIDVDGVKCWGNNEAGKAPRIGFRGDATIFDRIQNSIREPGVKAIYSLKQMLRERPHVCVGYSVDYFTLGLLGPVVMSMDSEYYEKEMRVRFTNYKKQLREYLGYSSDEDGFHKTPDRELMRKLALTFIQSSILTALEFISASDQKNLQDALRATGQSLSDLMNNSKVKSLLKKINGLDKEKQKLRRSTKSAFLADSIELAASWLQEKVK